MAATLAAVFFCHMAFYNCVQLMCIMYTSVQTKREKEKLVCWRQVLSLDTKCTKN